MFVESERRWETMCNIHRESYERKTISFVVQQMSFSFISRWCSTCPRGGSPNGDILHIEVLTFIGRLASRNYGRFLSHVHHNGDTRCNEKLSMQPAYELRHFKTPRALRKGEAGGRAGLLGPPPKPPPAPIRRPVESLSFKYWKF